jgi:NAD(P)-dependent dehydrogenase (short-subunit alcohol dehydrogenase family)
VRGHSLQVHHKNEEDTSINIQEHLSWQGWSTGNVPALAGKLAVVTGATSGLGYETALALAQGCADVIVAGRNEAKGRGAAARIRELAPKALVRYERLDLAELATVSDFALRIAAAGRPVDLLVNNAGVMALPKRKVTVDGFEMQLGVNYLGHFALTARLLPLLRRSRSARVVQVSSLAQRFGKIRFENLHGEQGYRPWPAYFQSKLAMVLFARELQRKSDERDWGLMSTAVHPGYARTNLFSNGPGERSMASVLNRAVGRVLSQSAADGAKPVLFAATSEEAEPGGFYGPDGLLELAGQPGEATVSRRARDLEVGQKLWQVAEELTGVRWAAE